MSTDNSEAWVSRIKASNWESSISAACNAGGKVEDRIGMVDVGDLWSDISIDVQVKN